MADKGKAIGPPLPGGRLRGVVTALLQAKRFGFIWVPGTPADQEYFFHETGMKDSYDTLTAGDWVMFTPVPGKVEQSGQQKMKAIGVEKADAE